MKFLHIYTTQDHFLFNENGQKIKVGGHGHRHDGDTKLTGFSQHYRNRFPTTSGFEVFHDPKVALHQYLWDTTDGCTGGKIIGLMLEHKYVRGRTPDPIVIGKVPQEDSDTAQTEAREEQRQEEKIPQVEQPQVAVRDVVGQLEEEPTNTHRHDLGILLAQAVPDRASRESMSNTDKIRLLLNETPLSSEELQIAGGLTNLQVNTATSYLKGKGEINGDFREWKITKKGLQEIDERWMDVEEDAQEAALQTAERRYQQLRSGEVEGYSREEVTRAIEERNDRLRERLQVEQTAREIIEDELDLPREAPTATEAESGATSSARGAEPKHGFLSRLLKTFSRSSARDAERDSS